MFRLPKRVKKPAGSSESVPPLDQIRQEEARASSQVLLARQEAEAARQSAINEAGQIKAQARQAGAQAGQDRCEASVQAATREAEHILAEAKSRAKAITGRGQGSVQEAARWAVRVVLGLDPEEHRS